MKRFLKIFFGTIAVIFILLLTAPFIFKGKIEEKVKEIINEEIHATVDWSSFSLSLIKNFPNLNIGLDGLTVINKEPFEGDTLICVNRFSVAVDVMSAISGEAFEIKSIFVNEPYFNLQVNADSLANWDIVPESFEDEEEIEDDEDADLSGFSAQLRSFRIKDARIGFADETMDLVTKIDGFNLNLSGDMQQAYTTLNIKSGIDALNVNMDGVQLLSNSVVDLDAKIGADLDNFIFTFEENELVFNKIPLFFDGTVAMLDEGFDLDVKLASSATDFKTLLALVPKEFMSDFEGLKVDGTLAIEALAKGKFIDEDNLPAFNLLFDVNKGRIQYPDLPKSIDNIGVNFFINNPGGNLDKTVAELKTFHFELDNSPFDAKLKVVTPISNATFDASMKGKLNLGSLMEAVELDDMVIKGILDADLAINSDFNTLETEKFEDVKADGYLKLSNFSFSSDDLPNSVYIDDASLGFTPKYVELKSFVCRLGESDFSLTGKLENYLAFALRDDVIKGNLAHTSKYIDANELMELAGDEEEEVVEDDSEPTETIMIPKNIDFVMTTNINKILYDKMELTNTKGALVIKNGKIDMKGVGTNLLGGSVVLNGEYNTENEKEPKMAFDMKVNSIDIQQAATSVSMLESFLPIAKLAEGRVSLNFNFNSLIGDEFSPILSSVNGGGLFSSSAIKVEGAKVQTGLATMLKDDKYKVANVNNLSAYFTIEDGTLFIKPFDVNVFGSKLNVEGSQGLDQKMNYSMKMPMSRKDLNKVAGLLGANVGAGGDVMVGIKITGTVDDPKIKLDTGEATKAIKDAVVDEFKSQVQEKIIDEAKEELEAKKEEIEKELEKEAEKLKQKAKEELKNNPELEEKAKDLGKKLKKLF